MEELERGRARMGLCLHDSQTRAGSAAQSPRFRDIGLSVLKQDPPGSVRRGGSFPCDAPRLAGSTVSEGVSLRAHVSVGVNVGSSPARVRGQGPGREASRRFFGIPGVSVAPYQLLAHFTLPNKEAQFPEQQRWWFFTLASERRCIVVPVVGTVLGRAGCPSRRALSHTF